MEAYENFLKNHEKGTTIVHQLNENYSETVKRNRKMIKGLLNVISFIARYELPLRATMDAGQLTLEEPEQNDGIFRGIMRLLAKSGDEDIAMVLKSPGNANYCSPMIQNELLGCFSDCVLRKIVESVNKAKMFTLLADETSSFAKEFLTIVLQYLNENLELKEVFIGFQKIPETSGETVSNAMIERLKEIGINLAGLVARGYDGASNMSGKVKCVQARIKQLYPMADYFHCASHKVNLAATDGALMPMVSRLLSRIQDVIVFLRGSAKRAEILKEIVNKIMPESRRFKVQQICPTRWVECHKNLLSFKQLFLPITMALQKISETESDRTAEDLLNGICTFESIIGLTTVTAAAQILEHLATLLQQKNIDLIAAYQEIQITKEALENFLVNEAKFNILYEEAVKIGHDIGATESLPLAEQRKRGKSSDKSSSAVKNFYHNNLYLKYFQGLIDQIQLRFAERQQTAFTFQLFLPKFVENLSYQEVSKALAQYDAYFSEVTEISLSTEIDRWKIRCKTIPIDEMAVNVLQRFSKEACLKEFYPNVFTALKILVTLPVTTASSKRSFSTLRRILTELRSSMSTDCLSSLAILSTHRAEMKTIDMENVVDLFDEKNRRISLK